MLAAVAVGMLESRAFGEISKERWKQIVVSYLSTFPAFPRALGQNLNPKSVNHVPGLYRYATSRSARGAAPCMPCDPNQIRDGMRAVPCLPLLMTQVRAGPGECRAYGARIIFGIGPSPAALAEA